MVQRIKSILDGVLAAGTLFFTCGMVMAVALQAAARWLLPSAPAWTEEVARICFVFTIAFGAGPAMRDRAFVQVDTLLRIWGPGPARLLQRLTHLVIAVLMLGVGMLSLRFVALGVGQRSPCLHLPMAWVYLSILILSCMIALYAGLAFLSTLRRRKASGTAP
jgi:TRAP-type C4-dicarboxylate transport system permease small subunit